MPYPPSPMHEPTIDEGVLRPTHVVVDLSCIVGNFRAVQARVGPAKVLVVLKANAYGHGLVPVAKALESAGADMIGVAYLEEGIRLRREGISAAILVLGGALTGQLHHYIVHDLTITTPSVGVLLAIDERARAMGTVAKVHLKVDTGMGRIGVPWYAANALLQASLGCKGVRVDGLYSHFASSDSRDLSVAREQLRRFLSVTEFYEARGLPAPTCHMANSGAILQLPEAYLDMVRPGIMLFGVLPATYTARTVVIRPALTWISRVVYSKLVRSGSPIGYGGTWAPAQDTRVVTVPVGYGDGYFRALSGRAQVSLGGAIYPVVGRVCMDQIMVDIGDDSACDGDEITLLGGAILTAERVANWADTIPYEVLTNINTRVPRVHVWGDELEP